GKDSGSFNIARGVRQGCVISPVLFIIVLDQIIQRTNATARNGIQWTLQEKLHDLDYADDICLMSHTFSGIQEKLNELATNAESVGLKINIKKTKLVRIGSSCETPLMLHGVQVEDVEKLCYLGSLLCKDGGTEADIKSRIDKARQSYIALGNVWRSNHLSTPLKLRLFSSNVKPVLLYGCETWKVTDGTTKQLQTFINKCLKRICKIFWPNWITNEDLLRQTGQIPIAAEIRRRKWGW
ncbi:hypothetical protein D7I40_24535, partial [Citrobacter sp. MH181794]